MAGLTKSIVEVAKVAGVSTATVSRVLNGLPGVREKTVAQVHAAVAKLKYSRLRSRSVRKPVVRTRSPKLRTGCIAVITLGHDQTWLQQPVMASVVGGIQRGAKAHDLRLMLDEMPDPTTPASVMVKHQVDGAIVFLSSDLPIASYGTTLKVMQAHAPVVWAMGMEMTVNEVDHIAPDNVGIGNLAFNYLRDLGCQKVGFLTTNPEWPFMRLRAQSFLNSAFDAGLQPTLYAATDDEKLIRPYGGRIVSTSGLADLIHKLVSENPRPDGLFVGNDVTMSYVNPLLSHHGIRIGKDIQVISCDAENARLAGMYPRPASIDIGGDEIGYRSVACLLNRIERPNGQPLIVQVAPRLQIPPATL